MLPATALGARAGHAALAALALLASAACSPAFNWRETPIAGDGLLALLPCKPDRASRTLPLAEGASVDIDMAGCEAGGATFAVAHLGADDAAQAEARLAAWVAATRAQWAGARIVQSAQGPARAAARPAPMRLDIEAAPAAAGRPAHARVQWFAQPLRGGGVALYQATVLGRPGGGATGAGTAEVEATFFDGLRLP